MPPDLLHDLADIDIYLFDQLLKRTIDAKSRVLDVGCGGGRNLAYLLHIGADCHGVDRDPKALDAARKLAASAAPHRETETRFSLGDIGDLRFPDLDFDVVIANAVLHFATDVATFDRWSTELVRVLRCGGLLFTRLATNLGLEGLAIDCDRRARLPDGSERFLVDDEFLKERERRLHLTPIEPRKTVVVHGQRAMTTWIARRSG